MNRNLILLGKNIDPVKALPWEWKGPGEYYAVISSRFDVTARTNPMNEDPPFFFVRDTGQPLVIGRVTYPPWLFREKLAAGAFSGKTVQNQPPAPITVQPPAVDPGPNTNTGQGSSSGGILGLSNSTLLIIGIAIIAVLYFIKKSK